MNFTLKQKFDRAFDDREYDANEVKILASRLKSVVSQLFKYKGLIVHEENHFWTINVEDFNNGNALGGSILTVDFRMSHKEPWIRAFSYNSSLDKVSVDHLPMSRKFFAVWNPQPNYPYDTMGLVPPQEQ